MDIAGFLLRIYSYLYHLTLGLFLALLGIVTIVGGEHTLNLPMLPWHGAQLTYWVLALGICGLLITVLAITGTWRFLFPLWCLFALAMMIRGYFLSPIYYGTPGAFSRAVWLTIGALVAFLGSLMVLRKKRQRTYFGSRDFNS